MKTDTEIYNSAPDSIKPDLEKFFSLQKKIYQLAVRLNESKDGAERDEINRLGREYTRRLEVSRGGKYLDFCFYTERLEDIKKEKKSCPKYKLGLLRKEAREIKEKLQNGY